MYTTSPLPTAADAPPSFGHTPGPQLSDSEVANLEIARRFLAAIEAEAAAAPGTGLGAVEAYYAPDVSQTEFPNQFVPAGAERDLAALRAAAERGRGVMRAQRFAVRAAYASGDTVILEVLWVGTLARPVGALAAGDQMRAHFAVFLELQGGRIERHRTYDCFEPF